MSAEPLFVAAVCALVRRDGRILSMLRSRTKDASPGIWEALSGRLQAGESPLEAVEREIREECGLSVRIDPRPLSAHQATRAGIPMVIVYYLADHLHGEVVLSDEHEDFAWLDADEFAARTPIEPLARAVREVLGNPPA
ncbi:MAG TPA: NUDIX domain-containing protein [Fibrobacteria bacterium]|nr:NUDIX domain-containing protein [Fibrobacteria bacterium]